MLADIFGGGSLFDDDDDEGGAWAGGQSSGRAGGPRGGAPPQARRQYGDGNATPTCDAAQVVVPIPEDLAGLRNQGGTCYLNSLLQVLYMLPEFRQAIYNLSWEDDLSDGQRVGLRELQGVFARLDLANSTSVSTTDLTTNAFAWNDGQVSTHHDVHELVTKLLERLHAELGGTRQADLIKRTFIGLAKENSVRCLQCDARSGRETPFMTLFVNVQGFSSLDESLKAQYCGEPERLEGKNAYKCDACGQVTDKELSQALTHAPPCLFLNLNRFTFNFETGRRVKVSSRFEFPTMLEMGQYITQPGSVQGGASTSASPASPPCDESEVLSQSAECAEDSNGCESGLQRTESGGQQADGFVYDLMAIISHAGSGYGGHYICYIRTDLVGQAPASASRSGVAKTSREDNGSAKLDEAWSAVSKKHSRKNRRASDDDEFLPKGKGHNGKTRRQPKTDTKSGRKGQPKADLPNSATWGVWHKFNDATVHSVQTEEIAHTFSGGSCAYMLLYRRRQAPGVKPPSRAELAASIPEELRAVIAAENKALDAEWATFDRAQVTALATVLKASQLVRNGPHWCLARDQDASQETSSPNGASALPVFSLNTSLPVSDALLNLAQEALGPDTKAPSRASVLVKHGPGWYTAAVLCAEDEADGSRYSVSDALKESSAGLETAEELTLAFDLDGDMPMKCPLTLSISRLVRCEGDDDVLFEPVTVHVEASAALGTLVELTSALWGPESCLIHKSQSDELHFVADMDASQSVASVLDQGGVELFSVFSKSCGPVDQELLRRKRSVDALISLSSPFRASLPQETQNVVPGALRISTDTKLDNSISLIERYLARAGLSAASIPPLSRLRLVLTEDREEVSGPLEGLENNARLELWDEVQLLDVTTSANKQEAAAPIPPRATLKFARVTGNSPAAIRPAKSTIGASRGEEVQVEVETAWTLSALKEVLLERLDPGSHATGGQCRLRLTNWAGEPQDLLTEAGAQELPWSGPSASAMAASAALDSHDMALGDEICCLRALDELGAPQAQLAGPTREFERLSGLNLAPFERLCDWWSKAGGSGELHIHEHSVADVYQDIQGAELVLLEDGMPLVHHALDLAVQWWDPVTNSGVPLGQVRWNFGEGGPSLRDAVIRGLLASEGDGPTARKRVLAAVALGGSSDVLLRELALDGPFAPRPGALLEGKGLAARLGRGTYGWPCQIVLHASRTAFAPRVPPPSSGAVKRKGREARTSCWAAWKRGDAIENAAEVVAPRDTGPQALEAIFAATGTNADEVHIALHDGENHRWRLLHAAGGTIPTSFGAATAAIAPPKGKKGKKSSKAMQPRLSDGCLVALLAHCPDHCALGFSALERLFDSEADIKAREELARAKEQDKRNRSSASIAVARRETREVELSLGGSLYADYS